MESTDYNITVRHIDYQSRWFVTGSKWALRNNTNNSHVYGTKRRAAVELIEDGLNQQLPTIYDAHPHDADRLVTNLPETAVAREKQEQIQKEFTEWAWRDPKRAAQLCRLYNERFNNRLARRYDGGHLTLPGSNRNIALRSTQKSAIWRILQSPATLLAHAVGGGKSFIMIAAGMELKRLHLARKPFFAVPNHLTEQFAKEFLRLYPRANLLVVGRDDMGKRRNVLMSRIATQEWDGIVASHSALNRLPVRPETELEFEQAELSRIEEALLGEKASGNNRRIIKMLERAKRRFEARMEELKERVRHDNTLCFEDLGIDFLAVDEAHYYRNLYYTTKMQVAGLNQSDSGRARDLYLKSRCLLRKHGRGVVFATGTPVANTVAELYTFMRYLAQDLLDENGLAVFDDWAACFGETVTCLELAPEGQHYRVNTRFARFCNIPEMMQLTNTFADIKTHEHLNLDRPGLRGGRPETVIIPPTPAMEKFITQLGKRAEAVRNGSVEPRQDNMLAITCDGRKAALDMRLIHPNMLRAEHTKTSVAAQRIAAIWRDTESDSGAQIVFCDLATPSTVRFNVYADLRDQLVGHGIPENQIAFVHDYESDSAKLQLYRDVNKGTIRVLLGSTEKLGCGTNVQERLSALHHLDSPWRPCDIEQREGRILSPGNRFKEVFILRYVTEGSFDAYMWQILESKIRFVSQFMHGESSVRTAEDVDSGVLSYAEVKALATGNPKIMEKAAVDNEAAKLSLLEKAWLNGRYSTQLELQSQVEQIRRLQKLQQNIRADLALRQDTSGDKFHIQLEKQTFTDRRAAGFEILRVVQHCLPALNHGDARVIGTLGGLAVQLRRQFFDGKQVTLELSGNAIYPAELTDNPLGLIASLESQLRHLEERLQEALKTEADLKENGQRLQASLEASFPHAPKLALLRRKQVQLDEELQVSRGDTMAVEESAPGGGVDSVSRKGA
jgi:hypothetical protein